MGVTAYSKQPAFFPLSNVAQHNLSPNWLNFKGCQLSCQRGEKDGIYTLSSVKHTPLGKYDTSAEAKQRLRDFSDAELQSKIEIMQKHVEQFVPDFSQNFEYVAPQLNIKTKLLGEHDDRSCYVKTEDRMISVFSGKIDTIFFAAQKVCDYLERYAHGEIMTSNDSKER